MERSHSLKKKLRRKIQFPKTASPNYLVNVPPPQGASPDLTKSRFIQLLAANVILARHLIESSRLSREGNIDGKMGYRIPFKLSDRDVLRLKRSSNVRGLRNGSNYLFVYSLGHPPENTEACFIDMDSIDRISGWKRTRLPVIYFFRADITKTIFNGGNGKLDTHTPSYSSSDSDSDYESSESDYSSDADSVTTDESAYYDYNVWAIKLASDPTSYLIVQGYINAGSSYFYETKVLHPPIARIGSFGRGGSMGEYWEDKKKVYSGNGKHQKHLPKHHPVAKRAMEWAMKWVDTDDYPREARDEIYKHL